MIAPELLIDGQVYAAALQTEREGRLSTGSRIPRDGLTQGEERRIALSHAVISQDVQGLAALLDGAKLHSNSPEHAAKYLLGLS